MATVKRKRKTAKRVKVREETYSKKQDLALGILKLYFRDVASPRLKRQLTLAEVVNAYKFTLQKLEGNFEPVKEDENNETLNEIKNAVQKAGSKSYVNKFGEEYFLHKKGNFYFFSRDTSDSVEVPENCFIEESEKTGLPILRKTKK